MYKNSINQLFPQNWIISSIVNKNGNISQARIYNKSPFYFIIQLMWLKNNNQSHRSCRCSHYHPFCNIQNQPNRFSFSNGVTESINFRESIDKFQRRLSTMNSKFADNLIFLSKCQKGHTENGKSGNLKQSLNDLQNKIAKAKSQLSLYPKILQNQLTQQQKDQLVDSYFKTNNYHENLSTIQSSLDKQSNPPSQLTFMLFPSLKTYYLANVQPALEGKHNKALSHLNISLKILKNQAKLRIPTFLEIERYKVSLKRDKRDADKKTLLIDIDQTLLRCQQKGDKPYDIAVPVRTQTGSKALAYIIFRPYAISFLKKMSKKFEIIAFTASHQDYADAVLDQIDPEREFIKHRLYRKNCFEIFENIYAKDLRIVNRDLSKTVLIDNSAFSYIYQLQNGIPILPYYGGQDNEFIQLQKYLQQILKCADVRELNKKTFKLHRYPVFSEVDQLVRTLYLNQY